MTNVHYIHGIPEVGTLDIQGVILEEDSIPTVPAYRVDVLTLSRNRQTYDIRGLLPHGWNLLVHPDCWRTVFDAPKRVLIDAPNNLENLTSTLHEIGHALDFEQATLPALLYKDAAHRHFWKDETSLRLKDCRLILDEECDAWDFAVQELQRMNFERDAMARVYAHLVPCLDDYVCSMTRGIFLNSVAENEHRDREDVKAEILGQYHDWLERRRKIYGVAK